jgi:PKD repeat protein
MRLTAAFGLAVFFLLGLPLLVSASSSAVVINEVMWDGVEYVELLNTTADSVDLTDWSLTRQQAGGEVKLLVLFDEEDVIAGGAYFLIEKSEDATEVSADKITSLTTLVNTGEQVTLLDGAGAVVDRANRLGMWYAGDNTATGTAMERTSTAAVGTEAESWHTSTGTVGGRAGTPGEQNSEPIMNTAPEGALEGPGHVLVGEAASFSAEDSSDAEGDNLSVVWSFGDGSVSMDIDATHVYAAAGSYTVSVTVSDGELEDEAEMIVIVSVPVYSDTVVINEFLPNPTGSDTTGEFIELKNIGSSSVDLAGWQLDDEDGGSSPSVMGDGTTLGAGEIRSFSRSDTKIALNNGGDGVRLLDPAGGAKSSYDYSSAAPEGQSYNRDGSSYVLSTTVTAGAANIITELAGEDEEEEEAEEEDSASGSVAGDTVTAVELKDIRDEDVGTMIETEGVVSAPPGILGDQILYLAGSGVQVYFRAAQYPELKLGNSVRVRGELGTSLGEYRVKLAQVSDIEVLGTSEKPAPHQVETGAVDAALEGSLVIVQGGITETSGDTFYLDDGSGVVKVFIKDSTHIDKPAMKKGADVTITGIVSRTTSGYRILPRFQEDVRLGRVAGLTSFPATGRHVAAEGHGLSRGPAGIVIFGVLAAVLRFARRSHEPLLDYWLPLSYGR